MYPNLYVSVINNLRFYTAYSHKSGPFTVIPEIGTYAFYVVHST